MNEDELDDILTRWAAGEISPEEIASLEVILLSNVAARRRLREHALLDGMLRDHHALSSASAQYRALSTQLDHDQSSDHGSLSTWKFPALLTLVTGVIIGIGFTLFFGGDDAQPSTEKLAGTAVDVGSAPGGGMSTLDIREVRLDSGTVQMRLPHVGYLVADGPAEFELENPKRMRIERGRLKVRVTEPSGRGFVVVTPHGEVTDLGTEFGVDVSDLFATDLVVFEGSVDLRLPGSEDPTAIEKLTEGEGVRFGRNGNLNRIMSVSAGNSAVFRRFSSPRRDSDRYDSAGKSPVIVAVSDNLGLEETKGFYEILPGGMGEDVLSYVDRPYEWNGLTSAGMPEFLVGADYVKTFCSRKVLPIEVTVKLARPADLYIFWDDRAPQTEWLTRRFTDTGFDIGLDQAPCVQIGSNWKLGVGPGDEVDLPFSVWHRAVAKAGSVKLGSFEMGSVLFGMYGIAAVEAKGAASEVRNTPTSPPKVMR